jgi:hypothetical protein
MHKLGKIVRVACRQAYRRDAEKPVLWTGFPTCSNRRDTEEELRKGDILHNYWDDLFFGGYLEQSN